MAFIQTKDLKFTYDEVEDGEAGKVHEVLKGVNLEIQKGEFVAHSGNWDLWSYCGTVYSIPVKGSGCGASVWCALSNLRRHLYHLRNVCGYADLIPADWQNVNTDFLRGLGIA